MGKVGVAGREARRMCPGTQVKNGIFLEVLPHYQKVQVSLLKNAFDRHVESRQPNEN